MSNLFRRGQMVKHKIAALDALRANVMLADAKLNITYLNPELDRLLRQAEPELKQELSRFNVDTLVGSNIDIFHKNPSHQRNMLATLFLSRGTPMLLAGDEFARSQGGNNNAYCQDNEISWLDWQGIDEAGADLVHFAQRLIAIRRALPMLRRGRFVTGERDDELGLKDVTWLTPDGVEMTPDNWTDGNARSLCVVFDGRAQETGVRRAGTDATLLLVLNAHDGAVTFTLPEAQGGREWVCLVDTNRPDLSDLPRSPFGADFVVTPRSLLLFMLRPAGGARSGGEADRAFEHVSDALQSLSPLALPGR